MVDQLTRITVDAHRGRGLELARALAAEGFAVRAERGRYVADSSTVEAPEARRRLRARGFEDREYRVLLESVLRWGVL